MRIREGQVFSLRVTSAPVPGCTMSERLGAGTVFSLAARTDISPETHPEAKLLLVNAGRARVTGQAPAEVGEGQAILIPAGALLGAAADTDTIYTEIDIGRNAKMNENIIPGEVFTLAGLIPVREGRIVNMDVASNDSMKLALMSFDAGTGLSDHAAPGDALIFALEGEGIIRYEGTEHRIRAGEQFRFARGGMHAVLADQPFKMALLLTLK